MTRFLNNIAFMLLVLALCHTATAQNPTYTFKSSVSNDSILIGDQVELLIEATVPSNYSVDFPVFADTLVTGIEILGQPVLDTLSKKSEGKNFTCKLKITSFDEGYYRIPPFRLPFSDGVKHDTAQTSPIWFLVNTLPPDSTVAAIYDIKQPIAEPITFAELAPWVGGALLITGLIALLIYIVAKRKKGEPVFFNLKPKEPPHIIAIRELEQLKSKKLWETDSPKQFQSRLTDIIRTYIEGRFAVPAMEQTTYETIRSLKDAKLIDSRLLEKLQDVLSLADLAKFAKFAPDASENLSSLEFGFTLVNETMIEVEEDSEEKPKQENEASQNTFVEPKESPVEHRKTDDK
jgi:hypothetical protein